MEQNQNELYQTAFLLAVIDIAFTKYNYMVQDINMKQKIKEIGSKYIKDAKKFIGGEG